MTSTMTRDQAATFRAAYEGAVKRYSKMTKAALAAEERALMADQGMERIYGGPASKDEFLTAVLNLRGYTAAKLNETIHALAHEPGTVGSTACEWCVCQVTWIEDGFLWQCTGAPGHAGLHGDDDGHAPPAVSA